MRKYRTNARLRLGAFWHVLRLVALLRDLVDHFHLNRIEGCGLMTRDPHVQPNPVKRIYQQQRDDEGSCNPRQESTHEQMLRHTSERAEARRPRLPVVAVPV